MRKNNCNNMWDMENDNNNDDNKKEVMNMNEIVNTNDGNFDMQMVINLMGQNAMTVQGMNKQLGIVATKVSSIENDVNGMKDEIYQLKNNEEITTEQAANIRRAAHKRVNDILGTDEEKAKYFRTFIVCLWTDVRKNAGCGSTYYATKKCNYQRVIDYIEAWIPSCGISELKRHTDEKAKARRKAKEEGYDC